MIMKKKKNLKLIFALTFFTINFSQAQQIPQFVYGTVMPEFYNPAAIGITKSISVAAIGRSQWLNITGHPNSQAISFDSYFPSLNGGVGVLILNNIQGVQRNTNVMLGYSFETGKKNYRFGFGLRGGIIQSSVSGDKLISPEGDYSTIINHNDQHLPISLVTTTSPDFSAGIFFMNKFMNWGIASAHLLEPSLKFNKTSNDLSVDLNRIFSGTVSLKFNRKNALMIEPSAIVKYDINELQTEAVVRFHYKNLGWIGGGYRGGVKNNSDAVVGLLGVNTSENFFVGYAYEYSLSGLSAANYGSHEIILKFTTNLTRPAKPEKIIFTPRF